MSIYGEQSDMFDEDKDSKGEIALANILVVETSMDPKLASPSVFDVHARVLEGGDSSGMRIFTFDAHTKEAAEKWMREICRATEVLELKKISRGWASSVSEQMVREKNARNATLIAAKFAGTANNMVVVGKVSLDGDVASSVDDASDDGRTRASTSEYIGGSPSGSVRVSGGGRGRGMGRGNAFRAGSSAAAAKITSGAWLGQADASRPSSMASFVTTVTTNSSLMPGESYGDLYGDGGL